ERRNPVFRGTRVCGRGSCSAYAGTDPTAPASEGSRRGVLRAGARVLGRYGRGGLAAFAHLARPKWTARDRPERTGAGLGRSRAAGRGRRGNRPVSDELGMGL